MFWTGLRQQLKDVAGYKFESITEFNKLRVEVRKIESQHRPDHKVTKSTSKRATEHTSSDTSEEMKELRDMMKTMASTVTNMGAQIQSIDATVHRQQVTEYNSSQRGRYNNRNRGQSYRSDRSSSYRPEVK